MILHEKAQTLYSLEAGANTFYAYFSYPQLVELWEKHCVLQGDGTGGADYDDEVYDALSYHNHFK